MREGYTACGFPRRGTGALGSEAATIPHMRPLIAGLLILGFLTVAFDVANPSSASDGLLAGSLGIILLGALDRVLGDSRRLHVAGLTIALLLSVLAAALAEELRDLVFAVVWALLVSGLLFSELVGGRGSGEGQGAEPKRKRTRPKTGAASAWEVGWWLYALGGALGVVAAALLVAIFVIGNPLLPYVILAAGVACAAFGRVVGEILNRTGGEVTAASKGPADG
jgi:hypothetical protein